MAVQFFVCRQLTVVVAAVEGEVDGVSERAHGQRLPSVNRLLNDKELPGDWLAARECDNEAQHGKNQSDWCHHHTFGL